MMGTTPFCRNQKDNTKQQKIVGRLLKHLTKMRQQKTTHICLTQKLLTHFTEKAKKQKTTHTFLRHQKRKMKSKKTTQKLQTHLEQKGNNTGWDTHF